ncbi:AMP-binding protein [Streptomyces syringium]|uniref:Long-chain acyl-CoA synthetase n=1 Tax=Streptomyces syringium TaxID=76729 RepID=A0ABS4YBS1_9ACTN|nr:AMP-binding protein [Streptomyces syringium]MBP2406238.1 long-chain acyl-CoA synthetase [Streptomyces syringium]
MTANPSSPRHSGRAPTARAVPDSYADKPWLSLLSEAQRAPVQPPPSVPHAFRDAVRRAPDRHALAYFDGRLTYRRADELSDAIAGHLAARGFLRGDRAAVMLQNSPHFVLAVLGIWKAGGTVVPLNPMYRTAEAAHILHDAGATALVCADRAWVERLREAADSSPVRTVLTACEAGLQTRDDTRVLRGGRLPVPEDAEDLLTVARSGAAAPEGIDLGPDDIALISYTSGTTGRPKGAMNTHGNVCHNAERQRTGAGLPEGCTYFALAPLFHITGMVAQLAACLAGAGTLALAYRFEPGVVLDAFLEHRPAYTVGPATAFMALMAQEGVGRDHFSSFRMISSGGAPLPPALVEQFRATLGPYLHNGYGLTECTAPCAAVLPGLEAPVDPVSGTLAVGVPGADTLVRVVDDQGADVPFGEQGEIVVRGPQVIPGYWRRPEDTADALPGGELRTGDIGFMDREGWLYVVDRKKDMINASGFKVWPREVEDVLYTHPAVREAAVVGVPDPYRGETVKAWISLRPGTTADPAAVVAYCRERLAAYKYPRAVEILPDLPKTSSGKILRRELRGRA